MTAVMAPRLGRGSSRSNLSARALSALVLGPLVLAAVYWGGAAFDAVVMACALISCREWARMVAGGSSAPTALLFLGVGAAYVAVVAVGPNAALGVVIVATAAALAVSRLIAHPNSIAIASGVPYLGLPVIALVCLRGDAVNGLGLLMFLVLVVWANDIAAYAVGRTVGGPKLAPSVSPNKTWSGSIGGVLFGAGIASAAAAVFSLGHPAIMAAVGAVLGVAGQAGDLFESFIKRRFKVKDSGVLIPGHGGMLDRVDSILTGAVFLAVANFAYREWAG